VTWLTPCFADEGPENGGMHPLLHHDELA
jgi:hypothetical protein